MEVNEQRSYVDERRTYAKGNTNDSQAQVKKFDAKNYLDIKLREDEKEKSLTIRLLPISKDNSNLFTHFEGHSIIVPPEVANRTDGKSGWKTYICLHKTEGAFSEKLGTKCPLCELNYQYYTKFKETRDSAENEADEEKKKKILEQAEEYKKKSLSNKSFPLGVIRCIERGKENEGPKFWRYTRRSDNLDPESIITSLHDFYLKKGVDIYDLDRGYDLIVTIKASFDKDGNRLERTSTTIIADIAPSSLTDDAEQKEKWIEGDKTWDEVFVAKPYEYLKVVSEGEVPWFDKASGTWMRKEDYQSRKEGHVPSDIPNTEVSGTKVTRVVSDDDIPFY